MPRHKKSRPVKAAAAERPARASLSYHTIIPLLLVVIATWVAYVPAMNGTMQWDDEAHVTRPELRSATGLYRIWFEVGATQQYYPLLHSVFWYEHALWGDAVLGYHLANLLWHSIAVVLVYVILQRLKIPGAILAAAIFALHPVMVESVAWISEQKNTLSAVFYLSAMLSYLKFDESRSRSSYFLALGLFVLALLTKTVTASLPAAMLVIFWWQRGTLSLRRDVLPLVPFFLLGLGGGLLTALLERNMGGAKGDAYAMSFVARGLLAGRAIWFYFGKVVWPVNLMFFYPRWTIDAARAWQWLFPLAALAVTVALWLLRRRTRSPLAAWLFFCGTLFPALGFLNVYPFRYSYVADHFQYLASLGMIVLFSAGVAAALGRLPISERRIGTVLCIVLVVTLAWLSSQQAGTYANSIVLNRTTIERNGDSWIARTNLAVALSDQGNQQEALEHLQIARALAPDAVEIPTSLASVLVKADRPQEAIDAARAALAINPDYPVAYNNLGVAEMRLKQFAEAVESLRHAVKLKPDYWAVRANLGLALSSNGQTSEAIDELIRSLQDNPAQPDTLNNLGLLLAHSNRPQEAANVFLIAVSLQPTRAEFHSNLASALSDAGSLESAIAHYQEALRLEPNYFAACFNLAQTLAAAGRTEDAVAAAHHAINLATAAKDEAAVQQIVAWLKNHKDATK